ncbi:hypothetical protein AQZ52_12820 [Novosphingobium fuchskuhlense]|uniref:Peptidase M10 serralysin C-terminal domain-containing protein n=1 Tax=Novosphingobium fuchskuhlense TaxID=1117702 RepID=A0A117UTR8_9SPHN|nr:FG-GAP-like repeat-containing protein [Novosphingobium fuchskuhlense]KUR70726.1 hypothetical protein AQZ52_12820 [Novosphingobium fuchskuhlense]
MADKITVIGNLIAKSDPGYADFVVQFVIPTDLNHDGVGDFIVQMWQQTNPFGAPVTSGYTNDKLFALVSNADGSYRVDNQAVFGTATPKLGGLPRKYVTGDINGDGVTDYAFAMNSEDYRSQSDPTTIYARPAMLLSKPGGGYSVVNAGLPSWGHSVAMVDNGLGTKDVVFAGYNDNPFQVLRYQAGGFVSVTDQYVANTDGWANALAGASAAPGDAASAYFVATHETYEQTDAHPLTGVGLGLFGKVGSAVSLIDFAGYKPDGTAKVKLYNTDVLQTFSIYRFPDVDYLNLTFIEVQVDPVRKADGSLTVVAMMNALEATGHPRITSGETFNYDTDLVNVSRLKVFRLLDGHLREVPNAIPVQLAKGSINYYDLTDVNGDGLKDIVAQVFTRPGFHENADAAGKPAVYINDGLGHYQVVDLNGFTGNLDGTPPGPELEGYLKDINGDGFADLVTYIVNPPDERFTHTIQISYSHGFPGVLGSQLDDRLYGSAKADKIDGGAGNDTINGGLGNDRLTGGAGADELSGGNGNDTLTGDAGNDRLIGDAGGDLLTGGAGDDRLLGGDGADRLIGGAGRDTLTGGLGADKFRFDVLEITAKRDTISDFVKGQDSIELVRSAFKGLASELAGPLKAQEFTLGTKALTPDHHIIYNQATGALYYDPDGNGQQAQVQITALTTKPLLDAFDILLV